MIYLAGEPDDMWWGGQVQEIYLGANLVWKNGPEIIEITQSGLSGSGVVHPLATLTVPPGRVWTVRVQGVFTSSSAWYPPIGYIPTIRVGGATSSGWEEGVQVDFTGTITSSDPTVAVVSNHYSRAVVFTGTIEIST